MSPTENINTLQVRTQVLLDNGETIVLGGIYTQQTSEAYRKYRCSEICLCLARFQNQGIYNDANC